MIWMNKNATEKEQGRELHVQLQADLCSVLIEGPDVGDNALDKNGYLVGLRDGRYRCAINIHFECDRLVVAID